MTTLRMATAGPSLVVLLSLVLAGCGYPSFDELNAELDKLAVPTSWRLADTLTNGPGGDIECVPPIAGRDCPKVIRYYVATGSSEDAYRQGEQLLTDAGFVLDSRRSEPCDLPAGLAACETSAVDADKRIRLQVFTPDHDFGDRGDIRIENRSGPIVSISMWRVGRD